MWICSCHAVTDGMIKAFAKEHGCAWKKMTQELKVGTQCGTCAKSAKEILEQAAGKPKRKRTPKQMVSETPDAAAVKASNGIDVIATANAATVAEADKTSLDNQTAAPSPKFLPCGKCVCTCDQ